MAKAVRVMPTPLDWTKVEKSGQTFLSVLTDMRRTVIEDVMKQVEDEMEGEENLQLVFARCIQSLRDTLQRYDTFITAHKDKVGEGDPDEWSNEMKASTGTFLAEVAAISEVSNFTFCLYVGREFDVDVEGMISGGDEAEST